MAITIRLDSHVVNVDGECPDCGFDALRRVTLYQLTPTGVSTMAQKTFCGRCKNEEHR